MKQILLLLVLFTTSSSSVTAQQGSSVNAMVSVGPFGKEGQLAYDYKWNRFSVGFGVGYFTSNYSRDSLSIPYPNTYNYNQEYRFRHFYIPVNIGYHIPMGNRLFIIPMATIGLSYNTSAKYISWTDHYLNLYERRLSQDEFTQNYHPVSLWAGLALRFSFRATSRIMILTAFHAKGTVTIISKNNEEKQRSSSGGLSFGIQYKLYDY